MSRYTTLLHKIHEHARLCGRNPDDITLVAVSKNHPWNDLAFAYQEGCRDFGENRVPELQEKTLQGPNDINWHFIGSLQRKKVPKLIGHSALIHSVDSLDLAEKISAASLSSEIQTKILLQVNVSGEEAKQGFSPQICQDEMGELLNLRGIEIQGLMTMAPLTDDLALIRKSFVGLRQVRDILQEMAGEAVDLKHLSMGMTHDYTIAIEEGATLLRVGRAIFA